MRSDLVIIFLIQMKQMEKMPFAKDHHMVKTVPPDRADQPLHVPVLPWRARRDRSVSNAHSPNTPNEGFPAGTISVANKVSRCILPTDRFGQLLGDPLGARMGCYPQPQKFPARMLEDQSP